MCNGIAEITSPLPSKKYGIEWKLERERSSRGKERNRPRGAVHFTVLDSKASFYQAGHKSNRGEIWEEEGFRGTIERREIVGYTACYVYYMFCGDS